MTGKIAHYRFKDPGEIYDIARYISTLFPVPGDIMTGIYELLLNAVEHGNLGMEKELKTLLLHRGGFNEEMARRLALPENAHKYVEVEVREDEFFCHLVIRDQGRGFNWKEYLSAIPDPRALHGRGLLIASKCGFDNITFNHKGNAVACIMRNRSAFFSLYYHKRIQEMRREREVA